MNTTRRNLWCGAATTFVIAFAVGVAFGGNRCTWTGLGGDGKWSTAANWQDADGAGSVPASGNGDTVVITGSANTTQDIADDFALNQLIFSNTTAPVALGGKSLSFTAGGDAIAAYGSKGFAVSNDITFAQTSYIRGASGSYSCTGDVVFYGAINASGQSIYCTFHNQPSGLHFYGPVTAASVEMKNNKHRPYYFHRAQHAIGKLVRYYGSANCFPEAEAFAGPVKPVISFYHGYIEGNSGNYDLVNNQTFDRIDSERAVYKENYCPDADNICHYSAKPNEYVTLTLQATGDASTWSRICGTMTKVSSGVYSVGEGLVNLVYDPQGDYTQTFNGRPHTLSGAIIVKGGTLESASSNTFALASRLDIRSGATFASNSTEPRSLAGVRQAVLAGTAKLAVSATSAVQLFGETPQAVLRMSDDAQLDFAADVTVARCFTNGVALAAGTYDATKLPQLTGVGKLVVASSGTASALLPQISAAGAGCVDIGLVGRSGFKAEMDMSWQKAANSTGFLGARKAVGSAMLHFLADDDDAGAQIAYGAAKSYSSSASVVHFAANQRYKCVTVLTNGCQSLRTYLWNGTAFADEPDESLKIDAATAGTVNSGYNLMVFAINTAGTAASNASATCYGLKIWQWIDGQWVLVRDLKPAAQDGACGLWDEVECVFYPATGRVYAALSATWTGAGDGTHVSDAANWSGGVVPYGGSAKFDLNAGEQSVVTVVNDVAGAPFYDLEAFGTNTLRLTGEEIVLSATGNAFSNNCPIYISTPITFTTDGATMWIGGDAVTTVDGELKATSGGSLRIGRISQPNIIFNQPITVLGSNGQLKLPLQYNGSDSRSYFNAKITAHQLYFGGGCIMSNGEYDSPSRCAPYFNVGGHDVDLVDSHGTPSWMFPGGNTFSAKTVWAAVKANIYSGWGGASYAHQLSDGTVETLNRLSGNYLDFKKSQMQISSKKGGEAILHLKGTESDSTTFCLCPTVSVIWEPTGVHTQNFSNRLHTTTGFIDVRGGAVASVGTNSFPCLSRLIVRKGAAFSVADTCPPVFGDNPTVNVSLESGATLDVPADATLKVGSLVVDGVPVAVGDYTAIEGVTFTGAKISVVRAPTETEWTGAAADGAFATVGNWTAGVPSAALPGRIAKAGTYTAAVASATTLGDLDVAAKGLATVSAAADVTLGGALTLGSPVEGLAGAYRQTAGTLSASSVPIALREGGTLELAGGNATVGKAFDMAGGTLALSGTSQLDYTPGSTVWCFRTGTVRLKDTAVLNANLYAKKVSNLTPGYAGGELKIEVGDTAKLAFSGNDVIFNDATQTAGGTTLLEITGSGQVTCSASAVIGSGDGACGELKMTGGTFTVGGDLTVAQDGGAGTLRLGTEAKTCVTGNLNAGPGAKLIVDVTGWDGKNSRTLATFGGTTAAFAGENVSVVGEMPSGTELLISATRIRLRALKGLTVILR